MNQSRWFHPRFHLGSIFGSMLSGFVFMDGSMVPSFFNNKSFSELEGGDRPTYTPIHTTHRKSFAKKRHVDGTSEIFTDSKVFIGQIGWNQDGTKTRRLEPRMEPLAICKARADHSHTPLLALLALPRARELIDALTTWRSVGGRWQRSERNALFQKRSADCEVPAVQVEPLRKAVLLLQKRTIMKHTEACLKR